MRYDLAASGTNTLAPGIKEVTLDTIIPGFENVLTPGSLIMATSDSYWMSGIVLQYKKGTVRFDVESNNSMKPVTSDRWVLSFDSDYTNPMSKEEIIAVNAQEIPSQSQFVPGYKFDTTDVKPGENPYVKPDENPYVKPDENPYIKPDETVVTPVLDTTPVYTPPVYTPPVYTPPVYTPPIILDEPFYVVHMTPLLILLVAIIVGIILFFVFKSKNISSAGKFISAFGKLW